MSTSLRGNPSRLATFYEARETLIQYHCTRVSDTCSLAAGSFDSSAQEMSKQPFMHKPQGPSSQGRPMAIGITFTRHLVTWEAVRTVPQGGGTVIVVAMRASSGLLLCLRFPPFQRQPRKQLQKTPKCLAPPAGCNAVGDANFIQENILVCNIPSKSVSF